MGAARTSANFAVMARLCRRGLPASNQEGMGLLRLRRASAMSLLHGRSGCGRSCFASDCRRSGPQMDHELSTQASSRAWNLGRWVACPKSEGSGKRWAVECDGGY